MKTFFFFFLIIPHLCYINCPPPWVRRGGPVLDEIPVFCCHCFSGDVNWLCFMPSVHGCPKAGLFMEHEWFLQGAQRKSHIPHPIAYSLRARSDSWLTYFPSLISTKLPHRHLPLASLSPNKRKRAEQIAQAHPFLAISNAFILYLFLKNSVVNSIYLSHLFLLSIPCILILHIF